jgi:Family of unknown function (DUF6069)
MQVSTFLKNAAIAGAIAAVINAVLFFIFRAMGIFTDDILLQTPQGAQPLGFIPVLISSFVPSLIAGVVCWLMMRYIPNGKLIFQILATVLLALSFFSPSNAAPNAPMSFLIGINILHTVVAGVVIYFLTIKKSDALA